VTANFTFNLFRAKMSDWWNVSELKDLFVDPDELPEGMSGFIQLMFLGGTYGMILMYAADMIGSGSELLLLVPSMSGIVGSVVLPVLGAVPDGCIVLFSGLGPDAQEQLSVGVGALAGSTVMLLTLPWFLCIMAGKVNIDSNGDADYKGKLNPPDNADLDTTGVGLSKNVITGSYIMLITALSYLLLQVPAMIAQAGFMDVSKFEHGFAGFGMIVTFSLFAAYLYYQYQLSASGADEVKQLKKDEITRDAIRSGAIGLRGAVFEELSKANPNFAGESTTLISGSDSGIKHLKALLKPFFTKYDIDRNNALDIMELKALFKDVGENPTADDLKRIFSQFDKDKSGLISYDEFVIGIADFVMKSGGTPGPAANRRASVKVAAPAVEEEDEEDEEEMPEGLADLSPDEQQSAIKKMAAISLGIGTLLVVFFSDPMVDVLSAVGTRTGIPAFYISFTLAPLAANISEVMASYNYAMKKTQKTIDISLSTLQGACAMNNTFVLGIFMLLIYFRGLSWTFFAETFSILLVQIIIAFFCQKKVHTMRDGYIILSLFPLAIVVVAVLEAMGYD